MAVLIPQILVAGLGNLPMPSTRHSLGQYVIDALASRLGIRMSTDRKGIIGQGVVTLGDKPISLVLYKSKSFMNVSGPSIAEVYRSSVKSPNAMIILQDSMSHRVEQVSVKLGGSANGHNGIKSIISALGGEQGFYRFRLGIGERGGTDAANFVMGKLTPQERNYWNEDGLDRVLDEIDKISRKLPR
ncbi:peptidyl-tRNA hydrolase [Rhodocollybia butyracea]|uniref:peptidyl-tRNA hydrolase n=1 Tax=Rhodocollybia butyracea TaxID=206335 RepID=A0A9P5UDM0_9AGAR|nr:peptidyl-tRNA hydrolase [Rhodocollybia butyracea]